MIATRWWEGPLWNNVIWIKDPMKKYLRTKRNDWGILEMVRIVCQIIV